MILEDAEKFALEKMGEFNLIVKGWTFKFDNAKRRNGLCDYQERRISISKRASLAEYSRVKNTILHEIAHVLCFEEGKINNHDNLWRSKAKSIGCNGETTSSWEVIVEPNVILKCPSCSRILKRHRHTKNIACGRCCRLYNNGEYDKRYILERIN